MSKDDTSSRSTRDSVFLTSTITPANGPPPAFTLKVRNISEGGMMVEGLHGLSVGEKILIDLRNVGKVEGEVVWVRDNRVGIHFDHKIDPRQARMSIGGGSQR